jgi:hypothetical protein
MEQKLRQAIIDSLISIKSEIEKRNDIYKYGVDLCNYENQYQISLLNLLSILLNDDEKYDMISWWLFESVDKVLYDSKEEGKIINDLNKVEDFVDYMIEGIK